jgi:Protein of unknown function (DUF998)
MWLGLASAVLSLAAAASLIRLHLLPTGLNPVRNAVSDYGRTPFHRNYRVMVVLLGVAAALLALGLRADTDAAALLWLWLFAACRVAIARFMTDASPPATTEGRIHAALAAGAFASIAFAGANVRWTGEAAAIDPLGTALWITAVVTLLSMLIPRVRKRFFGLAERALYATTITWLVTVALTFWS